MSTAPEAFFHAIPKVELHCHLLGTVRQATFRELAKRSNAPISDDDITAFYTRGEKPVGVLRVLRALDEWLVQTPDDLHRITYEYLQDAAQHHVRYAEFFWNPTGTVRESGMSYVRAQAGIVRAIQDAQRDCDIIGRLVPAIDREASPQEAIEMVQWMCNHRCDETIGLGIDYRETDRPPELFTQAYALAREAGFKTTAHAGEFGCAWTNVQTAVELLQVDRIDHGYTVIDAPAFAQRCLDKGLVFTVVPSNSYYLRTLPKERWALDHPIRKMRKLGLALHPNSDDPTLHHVTPTSAWQMMHRDFDFSLDDLRDCMLHGLTAAWIDDHVRRAWQAEFTASYDQLRTTHHADNPS
jgi:adenine deaminase